MPFQTLNLIYFSPTGTTRRTAQNIAAGIGIPVREIDRTTELDRARSHHFTRDDLVIIALPVYGGRLPRISPEIFAGITSDQSPTAIVAVYGNRHYDDALLELKNVSAAKGFTDIAAAAFIGEHSYSRNVAANRPDADDARAGAEFGKRFLQKACELFEQNAVAHGTSQNRIAHLLNVPGKFPYEKPVAHSKITPVTNDNCVDCQTCVEGCPMGAMTTHNPRFVDPEKCISCCYCIKVCPRTARRMEDLRITATINRLETQFTARREPEIFI